MIYTTGTIAINDNTVTGTGTNFSEPLSLIRVGCTLISVGDPVQIFTITEIKSSTELSVTPAADPAIPDGTKFSILLSDSISVDGLAQDVAETLRYYQGREAEISEAVDFFRNFNLQELKDLVKQSEDSASAAKTSEENAAQSEQSALDIKNQTEQLKAETYQIKNDTQSIKDSAVTEIDAAKDSSIQQIGDTKNSALQEMDAVKQETFDARDEAELARDNANNHANDAKSAKDAAESARDNAEQFAQQVNPENLLQKNKNLSDIADRAAAWLNVRPIGSTPLAGDPVDDHDATTKRWVQNIINTGTVGPTMNGVMNYGVGDFHLRDSRAYIQPYEVASDGQLLNRADWPELWAYAQMISPIEDADWLADPANRGKYSTGDGETTFRVPDRNGVQTGSISGLYARGDGGNSANDGTVQQNAAPDITGSVGANVWSVFGNPTGALFNATPAANIPVGTGTTPAHFVGFRAGLSNAAYGRDNTTEVRTNSFMGVWVIRASGGFVAANTSWSVINGDASEPASGTTTYGGAVRSVYKIAGAEAYSSQLRTKVLFGTDSYSVLEMKNPEGMQSEVMSVSSTGAVTVPGKGGFYVDNTDEPNAIEIFNVTPYNVANTYVNIISGHWYDDRWEFGGIRDGSNHINHVQLNINRAGSGNKYWGFKWSDSCIDTNLGLIRPGGSDRRLKDKITDITNTEGNTPSDRINRLVAREFEWLSDGRKDRGFVAQEAQEADKIYAFSGSISGMMNLNDRAILADVVAVLQKHDREISEAKAAIMEKENASLRANIAAMDERITKLEALVRQLTGSEK